MTTNLSYFCIMNQRLMFPKHHHIFMLHTKVCITYDIGLKNDLNMAIFRSEVEE